MRYLTMMLVVGLAAGCNGGTYCMRDSDCASLPGPDWVCATSVNHCVQLPIPDLAVVQDLAPEPPDLTPPPDMATPPADMVATDMHKG